MDRRIGAKCTYKNEAPNFFMHRLRAGVAL